MGSTHKAMVILYPFLNNLCQFSNFYAKVHTYRGMPIGYMSRASMRDETTGTLRYRVPVLRTHPMILACSARVSPIASSSTGQIGGNSFVT